MGAVLRGWRARLLAILLVSTSLGALGACGSPSYAPDGPYLHEVIRPASERQHKPFAVLVCTASDDQNLPFSLAYYRKLFLKYGQGTGNIYDYYLNMSYGAIDLDGSVVEGPYVTDTPTELHRLRALKSPYGSRGDTLQECITAAERTNDWSEKRLKQFVGIVVAMNVKTDAGATGIYFGSTLINAVVSDIYSFPSVVEHEMGHALGLNHSMIMQSDATGVHQWSPGGDFEYNDCWDIMSANACTFRFENREWGVSGPELEAIYREQLGWMPQDRVYTYDSGSQTVLLNAVSEPRSRGYLLAKIPVGTKGFYTIEYRQRSGWDLGIPHNAVLIHEYRKSTIAKQTDSTRSFIVARGASQSWLPGQIFQDTANKVRIKINTFASGMASVTISRDVSTAPEQGTGGDVNCGVLQGYMPGRIPPLSVQDELQGMAIIHGCDPVVHITAPGAAAAKFDGSPTTLSATVTSPQGDTIPDQDTVWTEVVGGNPVELGRGKTITANLPKGYHAITVTATDRVIDTIGSDKTTFVLCDDALCTPHVAITTPADGTHVGAGQSLIIYASVTDPGAEGPLTDVEWTLNGKPQDGAKPGNIVYALTLGTPGTYTLALTAITPLLKYKGSAQITIIVDPPSAPPTVAILSPMDGTWYYDVFDPGKSVQLAASGSANVVSYDWTDTISTNLVTEPTIDLGTGQTINVVLKIIDHTNCGTTTHHITLTGAAADGKTAAPQTITVTLRTGCLR